MWVSNYGDYLSSLCVLAVKMVEHLDDANLKVVIAFVAGSFSLLGAFAGAFLARRTEYVKWLRQNRSETFAEFLATLSKAQNAAIDVLHDQTLEPLQRDIRLTEIYSVPEDYTRVVRLYLPKLDRDEFSGLVRKIRALHSSVDLGDSRLLTMEENVERIQSIFEKTLND